MLKKDKNVIEKDRIIQDQLQMSGFDKHLNELGKTEK